MPKLKILILAVVTLVMTALFWRQLSLFFYSISLERLLWVGLSWLIFITISLVFLVLIDSRNIIYLTYILGSGSFFLFFPYLEKLTVGTYAICLLVFFALLVIAYEQINQEKEERLKLSLRKIWKRGLPFIILGLSLMIAVVYYFNPLIRIKQEKIEIPPQIFSLIIKPFSGLVGKVLPFYDSKMTIDEILTTGTIMEGKTTPSFESISPELMQKFGNLDLESLDINQLLQDPEIGGLLRQGVRQQTEKTDVSLLKKQRAELEKGLGITLEGNETFDIILAKVVNSKISGLIGPYAEEISIGIAVALFSTLILVGKIFTFLVIILARIIFSLLLLFKIIKKGRVMKQGEMIEV